MARCRGFLAFAFLFAALAPAQAQVLTVGPNVNINHQAGYQGEEAIAINPANPLQMFAWANNLSGSGGNNSAAVSTNGGASWVSRFTGPSSGDGWPTIYGDPTCSFDAYGNLYAASLTFTDIQIGRSTNGGQTFNMVTTTTDPRPDQPTIKAGPIPRSGTPASQSIWITYASFNSNNTITLLARGATSTGPGNMSAFGNALPIPTVASDGNFGDIAIGPGGKVAIAYQTPTGTVGPSTIELAVNSTGSTSGTFTLAAGTVPTNVGGFKPIPAQPNRTIDAEIGVAYDNTGGPHNGRLYLVYTDTTPTSTLQSPDTNILLRYSDTDGANWSNPLRVNDDSGTNSQFFPKLAIDPTTGNVAVVWYDARNSATNDHVQLWGTSSVDGGASVLPNVPISAGTTYGVGMDGGFDLGDYIGLDFYGGIIYPVWADASNSTGDNPDGTSNMDYYGARVMLTPVPEPSTLYLVGATVLGMAGRRARSWIERRVAPRGSA